ncbi:hypothetical protein [Nocardiopsis rhodophaea]|uniref:hypothetical protein n=1 Tax=Nocardiopsis rhodophaea TaxID=280238 RepID=UPI0031DC3C95
MELHLRLRRSNGPYTATNRVDPSVSIAASTVRNLEDLLDDIQIPSPRTPLPIGT